MTGRHDVETTIGWMRQGTAHLLDAVDDLSDDDLRGPSALPGWTRAHVIGHLARNAEALLRLATWARTGVETPMYADREQRAAEIEASALHPASGLRAELRSTASDLSDALDRLATPDGLWWAQVRSALGRAVPAAEIPWMRIREVWLHAVDLDSGATVEDLPPGVVDLLLDDVGTALSGKDDCPQVVLHPSDRERTWALGATSGDGHPGGPVIRATAAATAGWLTGRLPAEQVGSGLPALPRWI